MKDSAAFPRASPKQGLGKKPFFRAPREAFVCLWILNKYYEEEKQVYVYPGEAARCNEFNLHGGGVCWGEVI